MKRAAKRTIAYVNVFFFGTTLAAMGTLFFVLPSQKISDVEKRKLCGMPVFSWHSLFGGSYTDSLDIFVADQFPMREDFVATSFYLADHRGLRDEKVKFYQASDLKKPEPAKIPGDTASVAQNDSTAVDSTVTGDGGDIVSNMLIYNGMAIQFFGGNNAVAKAYAGVINQYRAALPASVRIYDVVVPSTSDLYLPDEYRRQSVSEKRNIECIYSNLSPGITAVDAYSPMMAHKDEYLFFNTDHHWTGLGAYYAYSAVCAAAGMAPMQLSQAERKVKKNWLGSLYWLSRDERLKENPDSAVYWKIPVKYKAWRYTDEHIDKGIPTGIYAEYGGGYGVFLGGDFPLMKVETGNSTGRSVLIVKNSFGNAFSTYFPYNFDKVYIIDYRYFNHSLVDLVQAEGITDVIFLNNSFSANTPWHIHRIGKLLRNSGPALPPPDTACVKPKNPADTTRRRNIDSLKPKPE